GSRQELPLRHRPHVAPAVAELADDGGFEARMHEAILAALVLAALPVIPVDLAPELVPVRIILLADQVAGALPAERRARDVTPRRARIVAPAGGELEKQRGVEDRILGSQREDAGELLADL